MITWKPETFSTVNLPIQKGIIFKDENTYNFSLNFDEQDFYLILNKFVSNLNDKGQILKDFDSKKLGIEGRLDF